MRRTQLQALASSARVPASAPVIMALLLIGGCSGNARGPVPTPVVQPTAPAAPAPPVPIPFRTIRGEVRDLDNTPLPQITIKGAQGTTTVTDSVGAFVLPYPVTFAGPQFVFTDSDQYEAGQAGFGYGNDDVELRPIRLQQKVFLEFGEAPLTLALRPSDPGRWTGEEYGSDYCTPCSRIRFVAPWGRIVNLEVTWTGDVAPQVWISNSHFDVLTTASAIPGARAISVRFSSPGESLVHVGFAETRSGPPPFQVFRFTLTSTP